MKDQGSVTACTSRVGSSNHEHEEKCQPGHNHEFLSKPPYWSGQSSLLATVSVKGSWHKARRLTKQRFSKERVQAPDPRKVTVAANSVRPLCSQRQRVGGRRARDTFPLAGPPRRLASVDVA